MVSFLCNYPMLHLENDFQRVMIEWWHSLHGPIRIEIFVFLRTPSDEMRVEVADKFLNLSKMIIVFAPSLSLSGLKEEVSCQHLVHHAPERPDICCFVVALPEDDFGGSILSSLNLSRKMVMLPTRVSQISNLYGEGSLQFFTSVEFYLSLFQIKQILNIDRLLRFVLDSFWFRMGVILLFFLSFKFLFQGLLLVFRQILVFEFLLELSYLLRLSPMLGRRFCTHHFLHNFHSFRKKFIAQQLSIFNQFLGFLVAQTNHHILRL
jgi:hypothetical protein